MTIQWLLPNNDMFTTTGVVPSKGETVIFIDALTDEARPWKVLNIVHTITVFRATEHEPARTEQRCIVELTIP